jgi:hypothetical protein
VFEPTQHHFGNMDQAGMYATLLRWRFRWLEVYKARFLDTQNYLDSRVLTEASLVGHMEYAQPRPLR